MEPMIRRTISTLGLFVIIFAIPYPDMISIQKNPREMPNMSFLDSMIPYVLPYENNIKLFGPGVIEVTNAKMR